MLKIGDRVVVCMAFLGTVIEIHDGVVNVQYATHLSDTYPIHNVIREDLYQPPYIDVHTPWKQEGF